MSAYFAWGEVKPSSHPTRQTGKKAGAPNATVTIDHDGFPHIIELILAYATPKARAVFSGTCKRYREALTQAVGHAHFAPGGKHLARPALASITTTVLVPLTPPLVQVLDLVGRYHNYCERKRLGRGYRGWFVNLHTVRRFLSPTRPSTSPRGNSLGRLMDVPTVVDYLDVDRLPAWFRAKPVLDIRACTQRHIIHLRWVDNTRRFPPLSIKSVTPGVSITVVLWPQNCRTEYNTRSGWRLRDYLCALLLPGGQALTGRTCTVVGPSWLAGTVSSRFAWRSYDAWARDLGDEKALVGEWVDVPTF